MIMITKESMRRRSSYSEENRIIKNNSFAEHEEKGRRGKNMQIKMVKNIQGNIQINFFFNRASILYRHIIIRKSLPLLRPSFKDVCLFNCLHKAVHEKKENIQGNWIIYNFNLICRIWREKEKKEKENSMHKKGIRKYTSKWINYKRKWSHQTKVLYCHC